MTETTEEWEARQRTIDAQIALLMPAAIEAVRIAYRSGVRWPLLGNQYYDVRLENPDLRRKANELMAEIHRFSEQRGKHPGCSQSWLHEEIKSAITGQPCDVRVAQLITGIEI